MNNRGIAFDPGDPDRRPVGRDGALDESRDPDATWTFVDNLPVTRFHQVAVDDDGLARRSAAAGSAR